MPDNTTQIQQLESLDELINISLANLKKDRDRDILMKRHGIDIDEPQTLEQIGRTLGITRERVRQIEKAALTKLKKEHDSNSKLMRDIIRIVNEHGGIITLDELIKKLKIDPTNSAKLSFLVKLDQGLHLIETNDLHGDLILLADIYGPNDIGDLHTILIKAVDAGGKPMPFNKIATRIDGPHKPMALQQLAASSHQVAELDNFWGLTQWPEVNPRSIRDKVYLVLRKAGKPMHFTKIAQNIGKVAPNPKKVTTQAVHNELIKDKRFVLIGRGIYALAEWGYQAGTVADIIEDVLKSESPLSKDEIVRRVAKRRQVKTTTIVLNLQEKPQFERISKSIYRLKQANN